MFDEILIFASLGILAGVLAGMFGIGGGLIIVPVLIGTFVNLSFESEIIVHLAIGTSIACIIFTGFSSASAHNNRNSIDFSYFKPVATGIIFGAIAGALFAVQIDGIVLKLSIGIFIFLAGLQILFGIELFSKPIRPNKSKSIFAGSIIGFLSSILGIGGGTFSVPYFKAYGLSMKTSIGTSAACGVPIAIFGSLGYVIAGINIESLPIYSFGYVYIPALIGISITGVFGAKYGAMLAHYFSQETLKNIMAGWFFIVSIYMILI